MKVRVQFYGQLRDVVGARESEVELSAGAPIRQLLTSLYERNPKLETHDKTILLGVGVEFVDRDYQLRPGDEVAIMPPVQGG